MGAAGDLGAYQGGLGVEDVGIDLLQLFPAYVVVAIAGGGGKAGGGNLVFLHGKEHLALVVLRHAVDGLEALFEGFQGLFSELINLGGDSQGLVHLFHNCSLCFFQRSKRLAPGQGAKTTEI